MPNKTKQRTIRRKTPKTKGQNRKKKKNGGGANRGNPLDAYASMIADPCHSTLVPGLYGSSEGLLSRTARSLVNQSTSVEGYILWCPVLTCDQSVVSSDGGFHFNVLIYGTAISGTGPILNGTGVNAANPFSPLTAYAASTYDPFAKILQGSAAKDARLLSACMKITYTGKMTDNSGSLCYLENIPFDSITRGGAAGAPASVHDLFQYAANAQRFGIDTHECVYRPDANDDRFYDLKDGPAAGVGVPPTTNNVAEVINPRWFGFAWRGVDNSVANTMTFDLIKNVEWRPEPISGFSAPAGVSTGVSRAAPALAHLDKTVGPSWTRRVVNSTGSFLGNIAKAAFGAVNNPQFLSGAMNVGMNALKYASPLLLM